MPKRKAIEVFEENKVEKIEEPKSGKGYILVICEKPQAAMKIAYALADTAPIKKNFLGVPYWEVDCQNQKLIVASAVGHLFGLAEKEKSQNWPVFDIEWQAPKSFAYRYTNALKHLAKNAQDFILACDYDVEGELIGFNALRFICGQQDARRMKFSTLTKYDLLDSYKNIMPHLDFGQAYAGETRHFLDFFYGISLSRALMQAIQLAGAFKIMSIGRVQGPALALVVSKEKEIQAFKPENYWQIFILVRGIELKHIKDIFNEKEAQGFLELRGKQADVSTEKEEKTMFPFPPFDLTSLQMEAYKFFGFSPAQTLAIAQKLYLRGLISYPRTSSQKLPPAIGYKRILDKLNKVYKKLAEKITREYPMQGKKTDPAHPAIFPTGEHSEKLSSQEKQVYELIVKRFISCFAEDALIEEKKIKAIADGKEFFAQGKKILKKGWLEVYPARIDEKELQDINGTFTIDEARIEPKETQPPKRYNPASLVSELEKKQLGTKTTRSAVVDTLYKRGYITGGQIELTGLGSSVALVLEKNCPLILDEKLSRKFEEEMNSIQKEKGKEKMLKEKEKILNEAKELLIKISKQFKEHENEIGKELLKATTETAEEQRKANTLCQCPACKQGQLIMIRSKKGKRFAGCSKYPECKTAFALPQYGLIKLAEKQCECGFPRLLLIRKGKPPWQFCFNPDCPTRKEKTKKVARKVKKKEKTRKKKQSEL